MRKNPVNPAADRDDTGRERYAHRLRRASRARTGGIDVQDASAGRRLRHDPEARRPVFANEDVELVSTDNGDDAVTKAGSSDPTWCSPTS